MPDRFHILVIILFIWIGASRIWLIVPTEATEITTILRVVVIVLLIWDIFRTHERVLWALRTYIFSSLVLSIGVLHNYINSDTYSGVRYTIVGLNPNTVATIIVLSIPFCWYFSSFSENKSRWISLGYLLIATISFISILLTGSRQAVIACLPLIGYIVYSIYRRANKYTILFSTLIIFISINFAPGFVIQRIVSIPSEILTLDFGSRMIQWRAGLQLFFTNPLIGIGSGAFIHSIEPYIGYKVAPDNTYLTVLYELGIIGFSIFLLIIGRLAGVITTISNPKGKIMWSIVFLMSIMIFMTNDWLKPPLFWILFSLLLVDSSNSR
jgi:O-antigen ligase